MAMQETRCLIIFSLTVNKLILLQNAVDRTGGYGLFTSSLGFAVEGPRITTGIPKDPLCSLPKYSRLVTAYQPMKKGEFEGAMAPSNSPLFPPGLSSYHV
jgi:hypothetical protein